jgi:hypothetical protein
MPGNCVLFITHSFGTFEMPVKIRNKCHLSNMYAYLYFNTYYQGDQIGRIFTYLLAGLPDGLISNQKSQFG